MASSSQSSLSLTLSNALAIVLLFLPSQSSPTPGTMSFHNGILPREGFHADVLGRIAKRTLLNPLLMVPAYLCAKYTQQGQELASRYLRLSSWVKILGALSVVRVLNNWLGRRAMNNVVSDTYNWDKEIVLLTGGADGIGKQVALMFASKNVKVVVLDVQPLTYQPPATVSFFQCDITSTTALAETAAEIRATVGEPTVLINNAGVCRGKPLLENTDADLNLTFNVNTIAHYKLAREFLPSMIKRNHGMVVTVASSAAWLTAPRMTEYAASKAAALAFHEGLAAELVAVHKAPKVRTVVVNQGYTRTKLFQGFGVSDSSFFGPALHVDSVAEAIVRKVLSGESGQIIEPSMYVLGVANFRSLPNWLQYPGRAGLGKLMDNWRGRQVAGLSNE